MIYWLFKPEIANKTNDVFFRSQKNFIEQKNGMKMFPYKRTTWAYYGSIR